MKKSNVSGTCIGKHDLHLERDMNAVFKANGLTSYASFERNRGRVTLVVYGLEAPSAVSLFLGQHPDFVFNYEQPQRGTTQFYVFCQLC